MSAGSRERIWNHSLEVSLEEERDLVKRLWIYLMLIFMIKNSLVRKLSGSVRKEKKMFSVRNVARMFRFHLPVCSQLIPFLCAQLWITGERATPDFISQTPLVDFHFGLDNERGLLEIGRCKEGRSHWIFVTLSDDVSSSGHHVWQGLWALPMSKIPKQ